jgi:hypothetical protein
MTAGQSRAHGQHVLPDRTLDHSDARLAFTAQSTQICAPERRSAGAALVAHNGGYRTSAVSRPSQLVTVIAVTGQSVMPTAQVAMTADQDAVRAAKATAVLIKRCRTVLTERCHYITK